MCTPDPYLSPFAWRYGTPEMREIWSEMTTRRLWRRIWVAIARVQSHYGLVRAEQVSDLEVHMHAVDLDRAFAIEREIHHDVMSEVRAFAEQCPVGGGIIHLGATSMDVRDNATALQVQQSLDLVLKQLDELLKLFAEQIERWAGVPCLGFTHLQPAEPTTIGYRLAFYAQDILMDRHDLQRVSAEWRGKGFKGAVGTSASYALLLEGKTTPAAFEAAVMAELGLPAWPVANQTYPRRQDWVVLSALSGLGSTLYRFAMDLRVLQSPPIGEWSEPFGQKQVGSSAMPFKRNPIRAEKVDSLARYLAQLPRVAWDNAANSLLERTLDDSANRRVILPHAFLTMDELLHVVARLVGGLNINEMAVKRTLATYGPFAGIEPLLMRLVKAGASRQEMHEVLREIAMEAWAEVEAGQPNPLVALLTADHRLQAYLSADAIRSALDAQGYVGDAPERALDLAKQIREVIVR
ncbi:MAG: adenylosuccinate lyase [Anaerolineae bacterium]|nr:adenylosuccinate lyase [Anaerolineae bacterium]